MYYTNHLLDKYTYRRLCKWSVSSSQGVVEGTTPKFYLHQWAGQLPYAWSKRRMIIKKKKTLSPVIEEFGDVAWPRLNKNDSNLTWSYVKLSMELVEHFNNRPCSSHIVVVLLINNVSNKTGSSSGWHTSRRKQRLHRARFDHSGRVTRCKLGVTQADLDLNPIKFYWSRLIPHT